MKKPYLKDLQSQLLGSVTDHAEALAYFSTDASIFTVMPEAVVYPKNTADVRKTVALLAERARDGKKVSITARGKGTDQSGGALGDGIQLVLPSHMNRILKLEKDTVTVQTGIVYQSLQQTLHTHGRFLPPFPASIDFSSIGGAIANNAGGEKSVKYGVTNEYVKSLKVVLADGSLIETKRISARELNRKKGQADFEGEIYRKLDSILLDNADLIKKNQPKTTKNTAGYTLSRIKHKDGSFDLSQILVGSQGTLGIVTEATLKTLPWNPRTTLIVASFDSLQKAGDAVVKLQGLKPSTLEIADYYLLDYVRRNRPQDIDGLLPDKLPKLVLLAEFDDYSQISQTFKSRRAERLLAKYASNVRVSTDPVEQESLWKIRRSAAAVMSMNSGSKKALPFIEDGVVPLKKLPQFLDKTYELLKKYDLEIAVWGHAGDANLHLQPFLDLSKKKDVDTLFDLADEFFEMVIEMGGSTCGEHNDGIMRGPYLRQLYGDEMYELFVRTKQIFDPQNILNPNVKIDVTREFQRESLRQEYSLGKLYEHLPHS